MEVDVVLAGFLDELEKIAAAHGQTHVTKARTGRRPISAAKLIEKHNLRTLFRKRADAQGNPQDVRGDSVDDPGAAPLPKRRGEVPTKGPGNIPQSEKLGGHYGNSEGPGPFPMGESPFMYQEAKKPKKKGDVPSKDDPNVVDRQDGRDFATTVHGTGQHSTNIGAMNNPSEHS